jgi:hypothetical protein
MEQLQELMKRTARFVELDLELPLLEAQLAEQKEAVADRKHERDWAILEAKNLENPNFFQRTFTRIAEKQEKAQQEARQAAAAYEAARQELEALEHKLADQQQERDALVDSREAFDRERAAFRSVATEEELVRLQETQIDAFRPVAIRCLRLIRQDLNRSHAWMQKSERPRYHGYETRQMEFWDYADLHAEQLKALLPYFPENSITLGASMTCPSDYIRSASMNLGQLDRVNIAVEQSLRVQEQIEKL